MKNIMNNLQLIISDSYDPWFNITVEDCIFSEMDPNQVVLFLWRNADTVIIGRAQNPWKECNLQKMKEDGVKLARRRSGGGAVYQDLGNTCFTFMAGKPSFNRAKSAQLIIDALHKIGIDVVSSGRNDLVVNLPDGPRKISGSAYRETLDRGFYHGTLLRDVDLTRLSNYLNPDQKKLQMKGIESVRSRVMNLIEISPNITHELFCDAVTETFFSQYNTYVEPIYISPENLPDFPNFVKNFEMQKSWDWNYGKTLEFTHLLEERFDWGGIELHLNIKDGRIENAQIFTDVLDPAPFEKLALALKSTYYRTDLIERSCQDVITSEPHSEQLVEFKDWLIQSIQ